MIKMESTVDESAAWALKNEEEVYADVDVVPNAEKHAKTGLKRGGKSAAALMDVIRRRYGFPSNHFGRSIVNAVTGHRYPEGWTVGSRFENRLWKVCDVRAHRGNLDPQIYFYDSPQQAQEHRHVEYEDGAIAKWRERVTIFVEHEAERRRIEAASD